MPESSEPIAEERVSHVGGYLATVVGTLIWGLGFPATRVLLTELQPLAALIIRFEISAVANFALLWVVLGRAPSLPRRGLGRIVFVALAGTVLNSLGVTFAISFVGAGTSSLVIMLVPVLTGLLAALAGLEQFSARKVQGLVLALAGLAVVVTLGAPGAAAANASLVGAICLVGAALGFAIYNVYSRPLFAHYSAVEVSAYVGMFAGLGLLPLLLVPSTLADVLAVQALSARGWLIIGYMSLFGGVVVFLLWYWALRQLGPTRVGLFSYLIPVWGLSTAALVLGERVTAWLPVGVALVIAGIVIANRKPRWRMGREATVSVAPRRQVS